MAVDMVMSLFDFLPVEEYVDIKNTIIAIKARISDLHSKIQNSLINYDQQIIVKNTLNLNFLNVLDELSAIAKDSIHVHFLGKSISESDKKNPKERTKIISQNLELLVKGGNYGVVREKSNMSTFSMPNRPIKELVWKELKWKTDLDRSLAKLLSSQRYWTERYIDNKYCKLIVHLNYGIKGRSLGFNLYRLKSLLNFIKSNKDRVDIVDATNYNTGEYENLLIAGDEENLDNSFFAESKEATTSGVKSTFISLELEQIEERINRFDTEFKNVFNHFKIDVYESRNRIIKWLDYKIWELETAYEIENN